MSIGYACTGSFYKWISKTDTLSIKLNTELHYSSILTQERTTPYALAAFEQISPEKNHILAQNIEMAQRVVSS